MVEKDYCVKIDGLCPHSISKTKKQCFIIMAYEQHFSDKIKDILKNGVREVYGLDPILSKEIRKKGSSDMYCTKVCRPIRQATLCVADLTYNNTNVGYEIAIAQKFNKPVIITRYKKCEGTLTSEDYDFLTQLKNSGIIQYSLVPNDIASDVQGIFIVEYRDETELKRKLKEGFEIK